MLPDILHAVASGGFVVEGACAYRMRDPSTCLRPVPLLCRYLVEIHTVDLANRKAHIMYMTGEAEELDLDEIVKEGHLTLHTA
mgnify:CR=1 FL=1